MTHLKQLSGPVVSKWQILRIFVAHRAAYSLKSNIFSDYESRVWGRLLGFGEDWKIKCKNQTDGNKNLSFLTGELTANVTWFCGEMSSPVQPLPGLHFGVERRKEMWMWMWGVETASDWKLVEEHHQVLLAFWWISSIQSKRVDQGISYPYHPHIRWLLHLPWGVSKDLGETLGNYPSHGSPLAEEWGNGCHYAKIQKYGKEGIIYNPII